MRVEDNGKGIDAKLLEGDGRGGHFGLAGMLERAKLAGGKLTVRTKLDCGTEIELTIPASVAYAKSTPTEAGWRGNKNPGAITARVLLIAGKHAGTPDRFLPVEVALLVEKPQIPRLRSG